MADITIKVLDDGPFEVVGKVKVTDPDGNEFSYEEPAHLCRCGLSTNMPFCTGAHQGHLHSSPRAHRKG